ncbi:hypothetical protein [Streptomyces sp. Isolate_219]|uniref:hypothetical protein n=1 Tax=Streptomyces sp. Isolate_219 TaxID=2950110 RepID=UPI0021CA8999|nr:hypothetical protein [Streptomyces sp. Isolate_219]MCR8575893.1 hypothetical protein [Streptomyces sp. Isolate_219]
MSPHRYVGRHTGGRPHGPNAPKASPPKPPRAASRTVDRRRVKKIALWVGLAVCLAFSIAVLIGLVQGFYEMDHPPGGWCQDNSDTCVHP